MIGWKVKAWGYFWFEYKWIVGQAKISQVIIQITMYGIIAIKIGDGSISINIIAVTGEKIKIRVSFNENVLVGRLDVGCIQSIGSGIRGKYQGGVSYIS